MWLRVRNLHAIHRLSTPHSDTAEVCWRGKDKAPLALCGMLPISLSQLLMNGKLRGNGSLRQAKQ